MMGAFGGCFAVRRACYHPAPAAFLVDDFYITMAVLRDGYQAINELDARCYEDVSDHLPEEFRRKARISAGNFQNLREFRRLLCAGRGAAWRLRGGRTRCCAGARRSCCCCCWPPRVGLVAERGGLALSAGAGRAAGPAAAAAARLPRCAEPAATPGCCALSPTFTA